MIKSMKIDWMEKWANDPRIHVELDQPMPQWPSKDTPIWRKYFDMHIAVVGDVAFYFCTDGEPTQGFGGRVFEGTFVDGKKFRYIGAWSSRAACVNGTPDFPQIVDVVIGHCATGVLADSIIEYFKAHRKELPFGLAWVDCNDMGTIIIQPTKEGKLKDSHYKIVEHI